MQTLLRWFWYSAPANPIVVRTVQGASRRTRDLWIRMVYLGGLVALVSFGLLARGGLNPSISLSELAKAGTYLFWFVSNVQVLLICLLAPLFMAGAIAQEQAGKTYEILLTTPLTNLQIVLGSLLGRLFFVLVLLSSGLPLFAVLLIFGGVPVSSVFVAFAVAALVALLVGCVAVTLAVLQTGGRKAVFIFVVAIAGYLVAAYVVDTQLLRVAPTTTWLTPLHPLLVLEASLNSANYRPPAPEALASRSALVRFYLGQPFAAFATLSGLLSFAMISWSTLFARGIVQSAGSGAVWRRWIGLDASGKERRHPPRNVRGNPIAWREAHTRGNRTGGIIARWGFLVLTTAATVIALAMYHVGQIRPATFRTTITTMLLLEMAVIVMVGVYMSAGSVSGEREDGTLDLILTTPVTPQQYIWGKLRGLVRFLTLLLAAPIMTMAIVAAYTIVGVILQWPRAMISDPIIGGNLRHMLILPESPLLLALILVPFVALCVMVGMTWSLKSKGVLGAVVPVIAIIGTLSMVLGMCGFQMAGNVPFLGPIVNAFSPATSLIMLINPWVYAKGFAEEMGPGRLTLVLAALVAAAGYSFVVYTMLRGMVKGFDHTVRRLSGTG